MATSAHLHACMSLRARPRSWLLGNQGVPASSAGVCTWVSEAACTGNRSSTAASGVCMSQYQQPGRLRSRGSYCADSKCLDPAADGIHTAHMYV